MSNLIHVKQRGKFRKAEIYFDKILSATKLRNIEKYARQGVEALEAATPKRTGLTSRSWFYEIKREDGKITIEWLNRNLQNGYNVALLIQYGHGTRDGHYVAGIDYINPALKPVFDAIAENVWKEVKRA